MTTIEALYKSLNKMTMGWTPDPDAASYKVYAGMTADFSSMTMLVENINTRSSDAPGDRGKVVYNAALADVISALGLPATTTFGNVALWWAVTTVDANGVETSDPNTVKIYPVGVEQSHRKDDPTANRHMHAFSEEIYRWVKLAASSDGALVTDAAGGFFATNTVTEYTYDGTNLATEKTYLSDATAAGSPAKLKTYEYSGGDLIKVTITDSTV